MAEFMAADLSDDEEVPPVSDHADPAGDPSAPRYDALGPTSVAYSAQDPAWWNDLFLASQPPTPKPVLKVHRLHPSSRVPAPCPLPPDQLFSLSPVQGWQLFAGPSFTLSLPSCTRTSVPTGIRLHIPHGYVALLTSLEKSADAVHLHVPLTCLYPDSPTQLHVGVENRHPGPVTVHPLAPVARFFLLKMETDVPLEVA